MATVVVFDQLLLLWALASIASAVLSFPFVPVSSALANMSVISPTATLFIGHQLQDGLPPLEARVVSVLGPMCHQSELKGINATGAAIAFRTANRCSFSTSATIAVNSGAVALLVMNPLTIPGYTMYLRSASDSATVVRQLPLFCVAVQPSLRQFNAILLPTPNLVMRLTIDVSPYRDTFGSWYYFAIFRGYGLLLFTTGLTAAIYLYRHLLLLNDRFIQKTLIVRQTLFNRLRFINNAMTHMHAALMIEACSAPVVGLVLMVGGWASSPLVSYQVWAFFFTGLSGFGFASSIMSAIVWNRNFDQVVTFGERGSWMKRIFRGDYRLVTLMLCVVPVAIDTAAGYRYATYGTAEVESSVFAFTLLLLQLIIGGHLVSGVFFYRRVFLSIIRDEKTSSSAGKKRPSTLFMRRLSMCTLGLGCSNLLYVLGFMLLGALQNISGTPVGWTVFWGIILLGRSLESVFKVAMFRPRPAVVAAESKSPLPPTSKPSPVATH